MNAVIFKNFSTELFVGQWDSVQYPFEPGQEMYMEEWKARHFAKHLIDRELNRIGAMTNDKLKRAEMEKKAILQSSEEVKPQEILDKNIRKAKSKKKAEKEEEFTDLKEE